MPDMERLIEAQGLALQLQDVVLRGLAVESESDTVNELPGINNQTSENGDRQCRMATGLLDAGAPFVSEPQRTRPAPQPLIESPKKTTPPWTCLFPDS